MKNKGLDQHLEGFTKIKKAVPVKKQPLIKQ